MGAERWERLSLYSLRFIKLKCEAQKRFVLSLNIKYWIYQGGFIIWTLMSVNRIWQLYLHLELTPVKRLATSHLHMNVGFISFHITTVESHNIVVGSSGLEGSLDWRRSSQMFLLIYNLNQNLAVGLINCLVTMTPNCLFFLSTPVCPCTAGQGEDN